MPMLIWAAAIFMDAVVSPCVIVCVLVLIVVILLAVLRARRFVLFGIGMAASQPPSSSMTASHCCWIPA